MTVVDYFEGGKDPGVMGRCKHKLSDILVIALASYLCGAEDYESMHELCLERGESLRPLVELPNGTPSTDTFERVVSRLEGETRQEKQYYISSLAPELCKELGQYIRGHWSIENRLHWHLDVSFREDACKARKDYSATNLNTLRKFALAIVSQYKDKLSLRKRLFKAALNINNLKTLLNI